MSFLYSFGLQQSEQSTSLLCRLDHSRKTMLCTNDLLGYRNFGSPLNNPESSILFQLQSGVHGIRTPRHVAGVVAQSTGGCLRYSNMDEMSDSKECVSVRRGLKTASLYSIVQASTLSMHFPAFPAASKRRAPSVLPACRIGGTVSARPSRWDRFVETLPIPGTK